MLIKKARAYAPMDRRDVDRIHESRTRYLVARAQAEHAILTGDRVTAAREKRIAEEIADYILSEYDIIL